MRKRLKRSAFLILLYCCAWLSNQAQQGFHNKAMLDSVYAEGFYRINLLPALAAKLQPDMRDIRIVDAAGIQVPFILKSELPAFKENKLTPLPILSVKKEKDGQTDVIIENTLHRPLAELLLIIKNTDADRSVTLSGSDDKLQWFVIKEQIYLSSFFNNDSDRFAQSVIFPNSNYRYFKIIINGKNILPVNIVKAGVYETSLRMGKYLPVPEAIIQQTDSSDRYSYVEMRFTASYFIDRLVLQLTGPRFYNRTADIYSGNAGLEVLQGSYTISSDKDAVFPVTVKTNRLLLKIRNNDNPPLQINAVSAFQLNKYLLAYLEKKQDCQLLFSDSAAAAPVYDLEKFADSAASNAATLHYGIIEKNNSTAVKVMPKASNSKALIWVAIGGVICILLLLTYKLTGEIKKAE